MDIPKGMAFWRQIMCAVEEHWSDSDYDSEVSIEGQEEFCDSSSDDSFDDDSSEPHTPESTDGDQAAAADQDDEMVESSQEREVFGYDSPDDADEMVESSQEREVFGYDSPDDADEAMDGQAEVRESSPGHSSDEVSSEPHVPDSTNRVQRRAQLIDPLPLVRAPLPLVSASSKPSKCDVLRKLLKRKSTRKVPYMKFHSVISDLLCKFCERGLHEEAKVLLEFEADVNHRDESTDFTPLHKAVESGDAEMVKILMQHGASASEVCDDTDETPLSMACWTGELECAQMMLDHGAHVSDEDDYEETFLMKLVEQQESLKIIELLLEKGADTDGLEPVLYDLIKASLGEDGEEQPEGCEYWTEVVRLLLSHGYESDCCDTKSLLKLSLKAFDRLFPLAKLLLEGAEPFEPDHECWSRFEVLQSALNKALRGRSEDEARRLLDKANALLDLPRVDPPQQRFTLSQEGARTGHQRAEWVTHTVLLWTDEEIRALIKWRETNAQLFSSRQTSLGWKKFVSSSGLKKTAKQAEEEWRKLLIKYKELRDPPAGAEPGAETGAEPGAETAATWKFYKDMDAICRGRPISRPGVAAASASGGITAAPAPDPGPSQRGKKRAASEAPKEMLGSGKKQGRKR